MKFIVGIGIAAAIFSIWIAVDLLYPVQTDFRRFDAPAVGRLETEMWRSYYERKHFRLFRQLARLMRVQFKAPYWRSYLLAFHAARAAAVFQAGSNREEYGRAWPHLNSYFSVLRQMSDKPFQPETVSAYELEWWIVRREPDQFAPQDWERLLCATASEFYGMPAAGFKEYANLRVQAMLLRDSKGMGMSEQDWQSIRNLLKNSWSHLHNELE